MRRIIVFCLLIVMAWPVAAARAGVCSYTKEERHILVAADTAEARYQTLYSGGNHRNWLDNVAHSVSLFRVLNDMPPLQGVQPYRQISSYPFDAWPDQGEPFNRDDWRLSTAVKAALDDDVSDYRPLLHQEVALSNNALDERQLPTLPFVELDLFTAPGNPVTWWLQETPDPDWSSRQKAVYTYIHTAKGTTSELLDWLQTAVTSSYSPWTFQPHYTPTGDWIYADWQKLFRHAYDRWQAGDGPEWAALAYELYPARPPSPDFLSGFGFSDEPIAKLDAYFAELSGKVQTCQTSPTETATLLAMVRPAVSRLPYEELTPLLKSIERTAPNTYAAAVTRLYFRTVLGKHRLGDGLPMPRDALTRLGAPLAGSNIIGDVVRLAQFFLATSVDEIGEIYRGRPIDQRALRFLNLLPYRVMADLAADDRLHRNDRARFARAAFARAYALGHEDDAWTYLDLIALNQPDIGVVMSFLKQVRGHRARSRALLLFVLWTPRLNAELTVRNSGSPQFWQSSRYKPPASPYILDHYQHSTFNWWCSLPAEVTSLERAGQALRTLLHGEDFWQAAGRVYSRSRYRNRPDISYFPPTLGAFEMIRGRVEEILRKHPVAAAMDRTELNALVQIPSAPESLSRNAIAWGKETGGWFSAPDPRAAEALHLAVRSTRYGCQRDGGHGEYSRAAFQLLHRKFGKTRWAEKTPYWFDSCHFHYSWHDPKRCG